MPAGTSSKKRFLKRLADVAFLEIDAAARAAVALDDPVDDGLLGQAGGDAALGEHLGQLLATTSAMRVESLRRMMPRMRVGFGRHMRRIG